MRFVVRHAPEPAAFDQRAHRHEIAVPATIVERREQQAAFFGEIGERAGVGAGKRDGFVDDDVLARVERFFGEIKMGVVGRGDDDAIEFIEGEQRTEIFDDRRVRVIGLRSLGLAGGNGRHGRAAAMFDYRCVKRFASKAIAHQAYF